MSAPVTSRLGDRGSTLQALGNFAVMARITRQRGAGLTTGTPVAKPLERKKRLKLRRGAGRI